MRPAEYIVIFAFFALIGWVLEVVFRSFRARTFVNPGFLSGPYLPIYGTGVLVLTLCATHLEDSSLVVKGLIYLFVTTGLEFITGFIFEGYLNMSLWDYSDQRFKMKNYVCLQFSAYWLILAFAFEYLILPLYLLFFGVLNPAVVSVFAIVLPAIMSADCTVRLAGIIAGKRKKRYLLSNNYESEFMDILRPLIENPLVQRLAYYTHHGNKTRFDHSMEVAWHSFLLSKRFSLDCNATVRGALLHDLFFYDWLREGPRLHGFRHPWISLKNAREVTTLSKTEEDIIRKHMWPLTVIPPRYMESWIVCLVDTFCSLKDYGTYTSKKLKVWNQG
jgi:uncharacterized protein